MLFSARFRFTATALLITGLICQEVDTLSVPLRRLPDTAPASPVAHGTLRIPRHGSHSTIEKSSSHKLPPSPANLLKPDGFQFYTYNEQGDMVTKLMTAQEIQALIAAGGPDHVGMEIHEPQKANDILTGGKKVMDVVQKVQSVLKSALGKPSAPTMGSLVSTIPIQANEKWSNILPAILAGGEVQDPQGSDSFDSDGHRSTTTMAAVTRPPALETPDQSGTVARPYAPTTDSTIHAHLGTETAAMNNSESTIGQRVSTSNFSSGTSSNSATTMFFSERPMIPVAVITTERTFLGIVHRPGMTSETPSLNGFTELIALESSFQGGNGTEAETETATRPNSTVERNSSDPNVGTQTGTRTTTPPGEVDRVHTESSTATIETDGSPTSDLAITDQAIHESTRRDPEAHPVIASLPSSLAPASESHFTPPRSNDTLPLNIFAPSTDFASDDLATQSSSLTELPASQLHTMKNSASNAASPSLTTISTTASSYLDSSLSMNFTSQHNTLLVLNLSTEAIVTSLSQEHEDSDGHWTTPTSTSTSSSTSTASSPEDILPHSPDLLDWPTVIGRPPPLDNGNLSAAARPVEYSMGLPMAVTHASPVFIDGNAVPDLSLSTIRPNNPVPTIENIVRTAAVTRTNGSSVETITLPFDRQETVGLSTLASSLIAGFPSSGLVNGGSNYNSRNYTITDRQDVASTPETFTVSSAMETDSSKRTENSTTLGLPSAFDETSMTGGLVIAGANGTSSVESTSPLYSSVELLWRTQDAGTVSSTVSASTATGTTERPRSEETTKYTSESTKEPREPLVRVDLDRKNTTHAHDTEAGPAPTTRRNTLEPGWATLPPHEVSGSRNGSNTASPTELTGERESWTATVSLVTTEPTTSFTSASPSENLTTLPLVTMMEMRKSTVEPAEETVVASDEDGSNNTTLIAVGANVMAGGAPVSSESPEQSEIWHAELSAVEPTPVSPGTTTTTSTTEKKWQLITHRVAPLSTSSTIGASVSADPSGSDSIAETYTTANTWGPTIGDIGGEPSQPWQSTEPTGPTGPTEPLPVPLQASKSLVGLDASTRNTSADIVNFARLCNQLAFKFWIAANKGLSAGRSLVVSPFGMTSLLAMIFLGARGTTSDQMNELLGLDNVATFNPHLIFQNVTDAVSLAGRQHGIANAAFVRELFADKVKVRKVMPFYKEQAQQFYEGLVSEVNFATISDLARRRTNLLIRKQTGGRIKDFVRNNAVLLRSPFAAISANVFQTDCNASTTSTSGRDGELYFAVSPASRLRKLVPVPAAVWRAGVLAGYEPSLDATAIALGRPRDLFSTVFLVPGQQGHAAPGDSLDRLEHRLFGAASGPTAQGSWDRLLKVLVPRAGLELQLPKFSHRSVVNATAALKRMGFEQLFSRQADLKGINGFGNRLYLSDVLQMNLFSTCGDENTSNGRHHVETYPASVSRRRALLQGSSISDGPSATMGERFDLVGISKRTISYTETREESSTMDKPRLKLDQPFLYFVRHNPTGMILHMGRFSPRL